MTGAIRVEVGHRLRVGPHPLDARLVDGRQLVGGAVVDADDLDRAVGLAQRAGAAARLAGGRVDGDPEQAAAALGELLALLGVLDRDLALRQVAQGGAHGFEDAEHQVRTATFLRWRSRRQRSTLSNSPTNASRKTQL